jgi:hypothetical protein
VTTSTFTCINAFSLDEFTMIAGDEQEFVYSVLDSDGNVVDLNAATAIVKIFPYGDPAYNVLTLNASISASPVNQVTATLTSACSVDLSGTYVHQCTVTDYLGKIHIPAQGKILIFPSA